MEKKDKIKEECFRIVDSSEEPLHRIEIQREAAKKHKEASPHIVNIRLMRLATQGRISSKIMDVGKGMWIYWRKNGLLRANKQDRKGGEGN